MLDQIQSQWFTLSKRLRWVKKLAKYFLPCCCICDSILFDIQHDHGEVGVPGKNICYHVAALVMTCTLIYNMTIFLKSWILTNWPQPWGRWEGGRGVWGYNVCFHVATYLIPFNLICSMTIFWKSWIWPLDPDSYVHLGSRTQAINQKSCLICFIFIVHCLHAKFKIIDNWVIVKFKYLSLNPPKG